MDEKWLAKWEIPKAILWWRAQLHTAQESKVATFCSRILHRHRWDQHLISLGHLLRMFSKFKTTRLWALVVKVLLMRFAPKKSWKRCLMNNNHWLLSSLNSSKKNKIWDFKVKTSMSKWWRTWYRPRTC